jgi:Hint module
LYRCMFLFVSIVIMMMVVTTGCYYTLWHSAATATTSSSASSSWSLFSLPTALVGNTATNNNSNFNNNNNNKNVVAVGLGFSPLSTVMVQDKGTIPISDLEMGDMVMGGNGQYQAVVNLEDSNPNAAVHYIHIHTKPRRHEQSIFVTTTTTTTDLTTTQQQQQQQQNSSGSNNNNNNNNDKEDAEDEDEDDFLMALDVTSEQMIYLYGAQRPILAQHVQVGDLLAGGNGQALQVSQIYKMPRHGRYAPIIAGGTILVNGFVAAASGPHRQGKEGLRPALLLLSNDKKKNNNNKSSGGGSSSSSVGGWRSRIGWW